MGLIDRVSVESDLMTSKTIRRLMNDLWRAEGDRHANYRLKLHFEFGAFQRYDYKKRGARYTKMKQRKYGHRNPNVLTGDLKRIILASARGGVRATYQGCTITAHGTQKHPMWAQSRNELEQISPSEEQDIEDSMVRNFNRLAGSRDYQYRKRKVIRRSS